MELTQAQYSHQGRTGEQLMGNKKTCYTPRWLMLQQMKKKNSKICYLILVTMAMTALINIYYDNTTCLLYCSATPSQTLQENQDEDLLPTEQAPSPRDSLTNHNSEISVSGLPPADCTVKVSLAPCGCVRQVVSKMPKCPGEGKTKDLLSYIKTTMGESTCSDWSTMRGGGQLVVSYSLFGQEFPSGYTQGLEILVESVLKMYPEWSIRVYHDFSLSNEKRGNWLCSLACAHPHVDLCAVGSLPGGLGDIRNSSGSVWRIAVMGDPLVKNYMLRDTDAPLLQREVDAVAEWRSSGKCFHVMRDNPHHTTTIMAGLWGGCGDWHPETLRKLRNEIFRRSPANNHFSIDQVSLNHVLWPVMSINVTSHDSYLCERYPGTQPYPTQREGKTFLGMRTYRTKFVNDSVSPPCPVICRPPQHQDWTRC